MRHAAAVLWITLLGICPLSHADIAVITHPLTELSSINTTDLRRIYLRQSTQLSNGAGVQPAALPPQHYLTQAFNQRVLRMDDNRLTAYWAQFIFSGQRTPPTVFDDPQSLREWVAKTPNSLGFIDVNLVDDTVKVLLTVPYARKPDSPEPAQHVQ